MARKLKPYKRKKGSSKQKRELDTINEFLDQVMSIYYKPMNEENKIEKKQ